MEAFVEYINKEFGLVAKASPMNKEVLKKIPLYLSYSYTWLTGAIDKTPVLWAKINADGVWTPKQLQSQKQLMEQWFAEPVVFVFDNLDAWQRKRLIGHQVGFVQPARQIFIPELLLQLGTGRDQRPPIEKIDHLSYPAQLGLLYHLQRELLDQKPFKEIATFLQYTPMTITRIVQEWQAAGLIEVQGAKEKKLQFVVQGRKLWEKALPLMRTPVKEIWFHDEPIHEALPEAGDTALGDYALLSPIEPGCHAIGKETFRKRQKEGILPVMDKKHGHYRLEVWHYEPLRLIKPSSKKVDKLSLYLSLNKSADERVEAAREELLNDWK